MEIKTIVLHHTATPGTGDGSSEWTAIANNCQKKRRAVYPRYVSDYHYGIGPTGTMFEGQTLSFPAWHCGNDEINLASLAVSCIGNFDINPMTEQQYNGLLVLMIKLHDLYPLAVIKGHQEIVATACPGRFFPFRRLLDEIIKKNQFSDVPRSHLFFSAIKEIVASGIMHGDGAGNGTFRPNDPVTRGELAQVICNLRK